MTYAVSLARSQRVTTSVATISIRHLDPELFGGFLRLASGVKVASPEKALFDLGYLSGGRSRRFAALPELELPPRFRHAELERWLARISSSRARTMTSRRLRRR